MGLSRRDALGTAFAGGAAAMLGGTPARAAGTPAAPEACKAGTARDWKRGFDNQRIADLGDGRFLNPLLAGDHPDPAILKDGGDYYMTFSSFDSYPGLTIWHSRDLVNWQPRKAALNRNIGSVWAVSLERHKGRYFLYIPVKATPNDIYVSWADHIDGPWSDPKSLGLHEHIDPCHAVAEDGSRWLFLSGGDRIRLSDDGLSTIGKVEHVYDPWRYPDEWDVESFSPEGPKIVRHGGWYYQITAVGGTAGPPTGHMVIVARSRSLHGPWENDPANPVVRTEDVSERWWSRGHASLVEAPDGSWWSVYHGFENGFWTLGRQALLDPIEWTADGWFRMKGGDLSQPIAKPRGGAALPHGQPLSDDFRTLQLGAKWNFFQPGPNEAARARVENGTLVLKATGKAPSDSSPLMLIAGDRAYQFECTIEIAAGGTAGLVLFYDDKLYCGLGFDETRFVTHQYGIERGRPANPYGRRLRMRVANKEHIVAIHLSGDNGRTWKRFDRGMEVSGYHHNVRGGFLMLRPGLYSAGAGEARFRDFRYRAL
ncbi:MULTISPECIES: family 43 glycosylhydrolase [Sphingomonas]|uniref:Family 43 glycosylhydrolase n=1 Tax=Sphingomonas molluscorum TaxID=418184 RepID=A0ABU8QAS9_9SPHN|nr:family 43 glycosylhydrolase [Sphingomonas sp. JUb134]MBM7408093.1 beta-xylosidase [Sphingomonas sp. JUb134]MBM7408239.1 beta-xylosidase [Sphingomonas sp. JUb134]